MCTIVPKDKDARAKLAACEKDVMKMRLAKAIQSEATVPVSETINVEDIGMPLCDAPCLESLVWCRVWCRRRICCAVAGVHSPTTPMPQRDTIHVYAWSEHEHILYHAYPPACFPFTVLVD